ncbi:MAG: hypothetical protein HN760_04845 [Microbacteriaceae bacterium]|nr:hypothetical protein [Microbacteriaceae bacterium]
MTPNPDHQLPDQGCFVYTYGRLTMVRRWPSSSADDGSGLLFQPPGYQAGA